MYTVSQGSVSAAVVKGMHDDPSPTPPTSSFTGPLSHANVEPSANVIVPSGGTRAVSSVPSPAVQHRTAMGLPRRATSASRLANASFQLRDVPSSSSSPPTSDGGDVPLPITPTSLAADAVAGTSLPDGDASLYEAGRRLGDMMTTGPERAITSARVRRPYSSRYPGRFQLLSVDDDMVGVLGLRNQRLELSTTWYGGYGCGSSAMRRRELVNDIVGGWVGGWRLGEDRFSGLAQLWGLEPPWLKPNGCFFGRRHPFGTALNRHLPPSRRPPVHLFSVPALPPCDGAC